MLNDVWRRSGTMVCALVGLLAIGVGSEIVAQEAGYLNHDQLTQAIQGAVDGNNNLARMSVIGTSAQGRDIWMVEVANGGGVPVEERPGVLIVANLEGNQLFGSMMALRTLEYLISEYSSDPEVQRQLDDHVFYIVPRLNPDGAEAMFAATKAERRRNFRPYDDDNDARVDEDGGDDLNGDGYITVMRAPKPGGPYRMDPDDSRFLVRADPGKGQTGAFEVYWEGLDDDGDGFYNEDGVGGVDLNRNFQHEHPYWEADAGPHMVSEAETRALLDFTVAHRNIAAILTYSETDNLVNPINGQGGVADASGIALAEFADESFDGIYDVGVFSSGRGFGFGRGGGAGGQGSGAGGGAGQRPAVVVNSEDREYFTTVSEAYRDRTGITATLQTRKPEGDFIGYGYYQFGVPAFSTPGWGVLEGSVEEGDAGMVSAIEALGGSAFVDWTPFEHPTLGSVEIGGFLPYAASVPPADRIEAMAEGNAEFAVYLASLLPEVHIVSAEAENHGGGVFEVTVEIENRGFFPSSTRHGVVSGSVDAVSVHLDVPTDDLITGDSKTSTVGKLDGSGSRESFSWVIRGTVGSDVQIHVRAQKGGRDSATVTLR